MTGFFERYGLRRLLNASGTETMHGASRSTPQVVNAMADLMGAWVEVADLQRAAGEVIARATGAEAGFVTNCSAAGIAVTVAAAMAGADRVRAEQLPDATGLRRKVILQKGHEIYFGARVNQMIRIAGAEVVEIGAATACIPQQLDAALADDVAAAVYVISHHTVQSGLLDLRTFCRICRARGVPVIVDAAAEYDWRGMIDAGATAVIFSAQKALAGPTAGLIAGESGFIRACAMQEHGIGRPMKAGKESIAGAMAALEQWMVADTTEIQRAEGERLALAETLLHGVRGLRLVREPDPPGNPFERLQLHVDPATTGMSASDLAARLAEGTTKVVLRSLRADRGYLLLDVRRVTDEETRYIAGKVRASLEHRK